MFAFVLFYFLLLCFVCLFIFCFVFCLLCVLCGYFKANIRQANNDRLKQVEDFIRRTFLLIDFLLHFRCQSRYWNMFLFNTYMYSHWRSNYKEDGYDPITENHLFSACPKQFAYVVVFCFVFNDLMLQVLIRFVDVSGIFSITVLNFHY